MAAVPAHDAEAASLPKSSSRRKRIYRSTRIAKSALRLFLKANQNDYVLEGPAMSRPLDALCSSGFRNSLQGPDPGRKLQSGEAPPNRGEEPKYIVSVPVSPAVRPDKILPAHTGVFGAAIAAGRPADFDPTCIALQQSAMAEAELKAMNRRRSSRGLSSGESSFIRGTTKLNCAGGKPPGMLALV